MGSKSSGSIRGRDQSWRGVDCLLFGTDPEAFYEAKCRLARAAVSEIFNERFPWRIHRSEGALFLWLWFPGLPVSSQVIYERLKSQEVLVIPGQHFFFGDDDPGWKHRNECIRVSYAMTETVVREGLEIIAEVVGAAFSRQ